MSRWTGRILTAFAALFLAFDGVVKFTHIPAVTEANAALGFSPETVVIVGIIELLCLSVYLIPRTAVIGAILMTGYLGGAVASQLRAHQPVFSLIFPFIIGALVWGGLALRDKRVRALI